MYISFQGASDYKIKENEKLQKEYVPPQCEVTLIFLHNFVFTTILF